MPKDEFNHVPVTNESQLRPVEFGGTQNTEFSFGGVKRSGINSAPRDELNDDIQETKDTTRRELSFDEQQDLIEQATESSNASAPSTTNAGGSGTVAPSAGTSVAASSGASTAGGAAASTVASTAAAAGTVALAAFAVTAAAPIIMSKAIATIQSLEASESEVYYELSVVDRLEDEKYYVILSNETFNETRQIFFSKEEPDYVTGYFEELEEETEYTFEVIEGDTTELTRSLAKKTIKTAKYVEKVSEFRGFTVSREANYVTGAFTVILDFVDEQEIFSDFALTLSDGEISYRYPLKKQTGTQTLSLFEPTDGQFDRYGLFSYVFSYVNDGQTVSIESEGQFAFTDISEAVSTLNDVTIDSSVDFLSKDISVTLDYSDELKILDNIQLHISYTKDRVDYDTVYPLIEQVTPQTITTDEILPYEDSSINITYYATCDRRGETLQTDVKSVSFVDYLNRQSLFKTATLSDEANFETGVLSVTLFYEDGFERFQSVELVLKDMEVGDRAYPLDWTTEAQPVKVDDGSDEGTYLLKRIRAGEEIDYEIRYYLKSDPNTPIVIDTGAKTFTDISGATTSLDDVSIESELDFTSKELKVTLSYSDPFEELYLFVLHISYVDSKGETVENVYNLASQTTEQIITTDTLLPYEEVSEFTYYATCEGMGGELSTQPKTITFTDYLNRESVFNSGTVDSAASFSEGTITVTLDYVDGFNRFDSVQLVLTDTTGASFTYALQLLASQTVDVNSYTGSSQPGSVIDITKGTAFTYEIYYFYVGDTSSPQFVNSGSVTFTDPTIFNLSGLDVGEADFENNTFDIQMTYTGQIEDVFDLELELIDTQMDTSCNFTLAKNNTVQTLNVTEMLDLEHHTFTVLIRQYLDDQYQDYKEIYNQTNVTFTDKNGKTSGVKDITFETDNNGNALFNSVKGTFTVTVDYADYYNYYANVALVLSNQGSDGYTFYLENTSEPQLVEYREFFDLENGKVVTYDLQYSTQEDGEQLISAKSGTVTFMDNATDEILGFEHGKLVFSDGSYYLPYKFTMGEKRDSEKLLVRIIDSQDGEQIVYPSYDTNDSFCLLDDFWQLGYFSRDDISNLLNEQVTFQVIYEDEEMHVLFEEQDFLYQDDAMGDFTPLGVRLTPYFLNDGIVQHLIYNGPFDANCQLHLKFVFESDAQAYEDCYFYEAPSGYGYPMNPDFNSSDLQTRLSNGESFDLYLVYNDGNGTPQEVLCYTLYSFQV